MSTFQFWSWSPSTTRWVPATMVGASYRFIEAGFEVAWGRHHPKRPGCDTNTFAPLLRAAMWDNFLTRVEAARSKRHRMHAV